MTRERKDPLEKLRAVFLATLVILSVFSGSVALTGTALADTEALANASADDVEIGQASVTQTVSFDIAIDSGNTDTVTVDLSNAVAANADIVSLGTVTSTNPSAVSVDNTNLAGNTAEVTLSDGDETGSAKVSLNVELNTEGVSTSTGVTYDIKSTDTTNQDSASFAFVDTNSPTIQSPEITDKTNGDGEVANSDKVTISATVTDAGNGVSSVTADASAFGAGNVELTHESGDLYSKTITVGDGTVAIDGDQTVSITATDGQNSKSVETNSLTVDNKDPKVTFESSFPSTVSGTANLNDDITVENTDGQTPTYEYDDGDGWTTISNIKSFDSTAANDGIVTIRVTATDDAGNEEQKQKDLEVDNAPTVETNFGDSNIISGQSVDVTSLFTVDDNGDSTSVSYEIGNGNSITSPESYDSNSLGDGTYTLKATANDDNGDGSDTASGDIVIDNKAPSITFENSFPNTVSGNPIDLSDDITVENTDSQTPTYEYNDGDGWTEISDIASFDSTAANDGTVTIQVTATDDAGNEKQKQKDLEVDNSAPSSIEIVSPSDVLKESEDTLQVSYKYSESNPSSVTITLDHTSSDTSYAYSVDESQYVDDGTTKTITLDLSETSEGTVADLAEGTYDLSVQVTDSQNNVDTKTATDAVTVDDNAPASVTVDAPTTQTKLATDEKLTVDYSYSDAHPDEVVITLRHANGDGTYDAVSYTVDNSDYAADDGTKSKAFTLSSYDSMSGDGLVDGQSYEIKVTATDELGNEKSATTAENYVVIDNAKPTLDNVEAEAGSTTVTVEFSEGVDDGSGNALDATGFAYQDENAGGATAIQSVDHQAGSATAELTLDADVTAADLGTDLVEIRKGSAYDNSGTVVDVTAVALSDTQSPSAPTLSEPQSINAGNQNTYTVTVDVSSVTEPGTVKVTLTDENSETSPVTATKNVAGNEEQVTLDVDASSLDDGDVSVTATMTDEGGNSAESETVVVQKDTVKPTIDSVTTNAGTRILTVTFSEPVEGADVAAAYDLSGLTFMSDSPFDFGVVEKVEGTSATYRLYLDSGVTADDIDNTNVKVSATTDVTDYAGSAANTAGVTLSDGDDPHVTFVHGSVGSKTVKVLFSENVHSGSDEALIADDISYVNNKGDAHTIKSVDHTAGSRMATVTLDSALTTKDLNSDQLTLTFSDSVDKQTTATEYISENVYISDFSLTTKSENTVKVSFTASEKLDTFEVSLTATQDLAEFSSKAEGEGVTLDENDVDSVKQNNDGDYVYTLTYSVERDGKYNAYLTSATAVGGADAYVEHLYDETIVDTTAPKPVDAEIVDAAELQDQGKVTFLAVQFNEPISSTQATDLTIGGEEVSASVWDSSGATQGELLILVDGHVATGDAPDLSVSGVHEYYGYDSLDSVDTEASTTLDTIELDLSKGQNFVSVPAEYGTVDIDESAFAASEVVSIMTYDDGEWQVYNPAKPDSEQDFTELEGGQGYIVKVDSDVTLDVTVRNEEPGTTAASATPGDQALEEGWNLVGHWQEGHQHTSDALSTIEESSSTNVWGQKTAGEFSYEPVDYFAPGEAYWVFVEDDEVYTAANYPVITQE